ncbi:MAG: hypothetical protein ACI4CS_02935 [Candidatus Weimeria sp.]
MIIRIIVTVLLVIAALLVYLIFVPIAFGFKGDFDRKSFKAYVHDPLRFINLRYDTSAEEKFSLKIFYFFKIGGKKKKEKKEPEKKQRKKKKKKPGDSRKKLLDFIGKRLKVILRSIFAVLKHCHIHMDDCDISFSTGEPDTTAFIYGGLSVLPFMYGKSNRIDADLMSDEAFVKGHTGVRGHVELIVVIIYVLKVLFTKG